MYPVSRAEKISPLCLLMLKVCDHVKRWQLVPCSPSQSINSEESWEGKSIKTLMNWDKDSLIGKKKAAHTKKANQGIQSLLPEGKQMFSPLQESRVLSTIMVTWEDKHHHSEYSPLPSSSLSFIHWAWHHLRWNFPWVLWDQLSWWCPLLTSCAPPAPSLVCWCEE